MKQRRMGRTGLKVSEICLGTMTFAGQSDEATSFRILDRAFERGVTFIDTADAYPIPPEPETAGRTEEVIGRWLAAVPARRQQIVLATKCRIRVGLRSERPGPLAAPHPGRLRGQSPAAQDRLRSISTRPIFPTRRRRSTRRCALLTTWFGPGRFAISVVPTIQPGSLRLRCLAASSMDGRATTASSLVTTSSTGRSRTSCCRSAATKGSA